MNKIGLIVVVLYKQLPEASQTLRFLQQHTLWRSRFNLWVVNNDNTTPLPNTDWYEVYNAPENLFLSKAYTAAYHKAASAGLDWLLIFDQDTLLNDAYEQGLIEALDQEHQAAAIIPFVDSAQGHYLAPKKYNATWGFSWGEQALNQAGLYSDCISTINSGACLKVEAIARMQGFPQDFPLDGLDVAYFYRLHQNGEKIRVIPQHIRQNLSVLDLSNMSKWRYNNMLAAEQKCSAMMGWKALMLWKLKLPLRALKRLCQPGGRSFCLCTLSYLFK